MACATIDNSRHASERSTYIFQHVYVCITWELYNGTGFLFPNTTRKSHCGTLPQRCSTLQSNVRVQYVFILIRAVRTLCVCYTPHALTLDEERRNFCACLPLERLGSKADFSIGRSERVARGASMTWRWPHFRMRDFLALHGRAAIPRIDIERKWWSNDESSWWRRVISCYYSLIWGCTLAKWWMKEVLNSHANCANAREVTFT